MLPGDAGFKIIDVPNVYQFMSIINNTDNSIEVYQDRRTPNDASVKDQLIDTPHFTQQTIPIREGQSFTFIYHDGGMPGQKKAAIIFSEENLGLQGQLGNPASGGAVTITSDAVGLAKQTQLPAALGAGGGVKVDVVSIASVEVANDAGNPLSVSGNVGIVGTANVNVLANTGPMLNRSGTITTGGVSQQIMVANANREYLFVQNLSTENLFINFGAAASIGQPSMKIPPDGSFVMESKFVASDAVFIAGATTGSAFTAKEG